MINPVCFLAVFIILAAMVGVWLGLCCWLIQRLELFHPTKYVQLGRPTFFSGSGMSGIFTIFRFLLRCEYLGLYDKVLIRACRFMKFFFLLYSVLGSVLFVIVWKFRWW